MLLSKYQVESEAEDFALYVVKETGGEKKRNSTLFPEYFFKKNQTIRAAPGARPRVPTAPARRPRPEGGHREALPHGQEEHHRDTARGGAVPQVIRNSNSNLN